MKDIRAHTAFLAYILLYCTALGLLFSIPKLSGKWWLILFLLIRCIMQGYNYLPLVLLQNNIYTFEQYHAFFDTWGFGVELINVISYGLLVAFLLTLKFPGGAHSGIFRSLFLFRGRVGRQFFWVVILTLLAVNTLAWLIMTAATKNRAANNRAGVMVVVFCILLCFLISAWISLATQVKRWHDLSKSGWWVLIGFIPVIGWMWTLIETGCLKGSIDPNEFGPAPSQQPAASSIGGPASETI